MVPFDIYEHPDFAPQDGDDARRDGAILAAVAATGVAAAAVCGALASVRLGLAPAQLVALVKHVGLS